MSKNLATILAAATPIEMIKSNELTTLIQSIERGERPMAPGLYITRNEYHSPVILSVPQDGTVRAVGWTTGGTPVGYSRNCEYGYSSADPCPTDRLMTTHALQAGTDDPYVRIIRQDGEQFTLQFFPRRGIAAICQQLGFGLADVAEVQYLARKPQ